MPRPVRRNRPDRASLPARRMLGLALLFGICGGVVGALQALTGHRSASDAVELIGLYAVLWFLLAGCVLLATRWLARHPRRR